MSSVESASIPPRINEASCCIGLINLRHAPKYRTILSALKSGCSPTPTYLSLYRYTIAKRTRFKESSSRLARSPFHRSKAVSLNNCLTSSRVTSGTILAGNTDKSNGSSSQSPVTPAIGYRAILLSVMTLSLPHTLRTPALGIHSEIRGRPARVDPLQDFLCGRDCVGDARFNRGCRTRSELRESSRRQDCGRNWHCALSSLVHPYIPQLTFICCEW
jgi:hypothetical protein